MALPPARERANLWVISAGQFLSLAGMTALLPLMPLYLPTLGVTDLVEIKKWTGLIGSAPFAVAVFATPLWGAAADRTGHKAMVVRSIAGIAIATLGMGIATSPAQLLFWRGVQGVLSGVFPAAVALVSATTPEARLARSLGVLQGARAAGGLAGPMIGGVLADLVGIGPMFFIAGTISAVTALVCATVIREEKRGAHADGAAASPGAPIAPPPVKLLDLARRPAMAGMFALIVLFQLVLMASYPTFALFVEKIGVERDRIATVTGFLFAASGLPSLLTASSWGRIADRVGYLPLMITSLFLTGLWVLLTGLTHGPLPLLFALRMLLGLSLAGFIPIAFAWMGARAPAGARGRVAGLGSTAMMLGNVLGPLAGSWLAVHFGIFATFTVPGAVMLAVAALLAVAIAFDRL